MKHMLTTDDFANAYSESFLKTRRFLISRGIADATAEEVAQAAWSKGWERRSQLRERDKVGQWINTIALNLLRNQMRKQKRLTSLEENLDRPVRNALAERTDARTILSGATEEERRILVLQAVEGLTSQEIGECCGLTPVAVRVRLHRAKRRLRSKFSCQSASGRSAGVPSKRTGCKLRVRKATETH